MTEHQLTEYVDHLSRQVPHVEPPLGQVLADGRAAVRRRRRRRGAAALAAVAVAVAAVTVGPRLLFQQAPDDTGSLPATASPHVPQGMRLVGVAGVAIAVPDTWSHDPTQPACGFATESWAVAGNAPGPVCTGALAPVTHLALAAAVDDAPSQIGMKRVRFVIDGDEVVRDQTCGPVEVPPGSTERGCEVRWYLSEHDVLLDAYVAGDDAEDVVGWMERGLQVLPPGWTTSATDATVVRSGSTADPALTDVELALATVAARRQLRGTDARLASASVVGVAGTILQTVTGEPCSSGRLLRVSLSGDFPDIATTGTPAGGAGPIRLVTIDVDGESGEICQVGVSTSETGALPGATPIPLDALR